MFLISQSAVLLLEHPRMSRAVRIMYAFTVLSLLSEIMESRLDNRIVAFVSLVFVCVCVCVTLLFCVFALGFCLVFSFFVWFHSFFYSFGQGGGGLFVCPVLLLV